MNFITPRTFKADKAWQALDIANMDGVTVRMHWTDQPYHWHENDGQEVFVVLEGAVNMHHRNREGEAVWRMGPGDICHFKEGDEHRAVPEGAAYILVIEREGSV